MKRLLIFFLFLAATANGQKIIKSLKLDSAIFYGINNVRIQNDKPPVIKFFYGKIREFSYSVTEKNCSSNYFEHSLMDSTRKYCTTECIYQNKLVFGNASSFDIELHPETIPVFAKDVVDAWMASPSHAHALLKVWNRSFTITSKIEIATDNKTAILSVSYHAVQHTDRLGEIPIGLQQWSKYYMK